jgi:magnesium and cobalt transporter
MATRTDDPPDTASDTAAAAEKPAAGAPAAGAPAAAGHGAGKARKRTATAKPKPRTADAPARTTWRSRLTRTLAGGIREPAQLLELLREAAARGLIDADALAMVEGSLSMGALQARDLMVPRSEMVCIRREDALASILSAVVQSGHSRFPVLDGDRDDVVGILLAKDLLRAVQAGRGLQPGGDARRLAFDMREYLRPAVFVPESKRLNVLLKEFRGNRNHMAIVVDEYGGVAGLITIEDVIEQVIGEIDDEYDVEDDQAIRDEPNGRSIVRGATPIAEFNAHFGTQFADDEFDTIAGLVMQQFGRVPRRGESVTLDEFAFHVLRMDRRRIETLRVTRA